MAIKKPSILWRYNRITGYWEAERSCIVGATCEEWLRVYSNDEPRELFKVAVKRPSGTSARDKEKLWSMPPKKNPARRPSRITKKAPSMRKIKNQPASLVYSPIAIYYDSEYGEYQVRVKGRPNDTYFTNDKADAISTAQRMRNNALLTPMKKNPTTRKTAARTQRAAESYVRRPSQITKKAPSKRLKTRRTINLQSPRGVFPNPKKRDPAKREKQIIVEYELSGQNFAKRNRGMYGWKELAAFPDTPEGSENAIQYAQAYHKIAPHLRIQVVTK